MRGKASQVAFRLFQISFISREPLTQCSFHVYTRKISSSLKYMVSIQSMLCHRGKGGEPWVCLLSSLSQKGPLPFPNYRIPWEFLGELCLELQCLEMMHFYTMSCLFAVELVQHTASNYFDLFCSAFPPCPVSEHQLPWSPQSISHSGQTTEGVRSALKATRNCEW